MNILNLIKRKIFNNNFKESYSQGGEDILISNIFKQLRITKPSYLDIGAYDAIYLSNTYLFYKNGGHGVLIEPDPLLFGDLKQKRSRDTILNIGIGSNTQKSAKFYIMSTKTLNTFSEQEALRYETYGSNKIEQVIEIPLLNINDVVDKYFPKTPNLISIDVEGLDLEIIKSFNFAKHRPDVFCIETITYSEDDSGNKVTEIIDFMKNEGYAIYADTHINTIFVDNKKWHGCN